MYITAPNSPLVAFLTPLQCAAQGRGKWIFGPKPTKILGVATRNGRTRARSTFSRAGAGELIRACVRCVLNRPRLGVAWAQAFSFWGRLFGLGLLAPGMAGGILPGWRVGGFSCGAGRVCAAWALGPALRWPLACACVRIAAGLAWCVGSAATWENSRLFPARIGGTVPAAWWSWCRVDRWPGLLPVPFVMCGRSCGRVCVYSPGGDAGGIMAGLWVCCLLWIVCRMPWKITENLQENSPEKRPRKIFQKNSPYGGTVCAGNFFAKRG